jgi:integrase
MAVSEGHLERNHALLLYTPRDAWLAERRVIKIQEVQICFANAALPEGLLGEIEAWRVLSIITDDDAWVFPSERMTPLSKDNCWNRNIKRKLQKAGLRWANFLVMRRTHSTSIGELGVDGKLLADE